MLAMNVVIWILAGAHCLGALGLIPAVVAFRRRCVHIRSWLYAVGAGLLFFAPVMFVVTLVMAFVVAEPDPVLGRVWFVFFLAGHAVLAIFGALGMIIGAWLRLLAAQAELEKLDGRDKPSPDRTGSQSL